MGRLGEVDLSLDISKKKALNQLAGEQARLTELRLTLGGQLGDGSLGPPVLILFEGWDASGKGGAIKRLVFPLDPRHVRVSQFAAPTEDEKRHHFLNRFQSSLPGWGGMAILDRSWYGRVLVERVEGFTPEPVWRRSYGEIRNFEEGLAAEGMVIVKFWMQISKDEQLKRFEARAKNPIKQWKLTEEDWRNRERWHEYEQAVEEMIEETDREFAPWVVVPAESKRYARIAVVEEVNARIEAGMKRWGVPVPPG
ncbi:MAG: UDP-galactose-lipid carrier transferase [Solirubrobacterales bacterium]|nr:UDP-galactose-lipid carrier transferase [Solirubrobacterales bacterium]